MIMYPESVYSAFDLRKAFDSVSHLIILSNLVNFVFDSAFLILFKAYQTNQSNS